MFERIRPLIDVQPSCLCLPVHKFVRAEAADAFQGRGQRRGVEAEEYLASNRV